MTTAGRATFEPARAGRGRMEGDLGALGKHYSSREQPAHTKLKYRQDGQSSASDLRSRDFRRELEDREHDVRERKDRERNRESGMSSKRQKLDQIPANIDQDDPVDVDDSESGSDDDEDETAELMAELQRIKKERANEAAKREVEKRQEEERIRMENIVKGNPLMNQQTDKSDFKVKRRWDDDVVFKNCARGEKDKPDFINDTLRSDFHRKFMAKYIK